MMGDIDIERTPPVVGTFVKTGAPSLVEALGHTDLDFILIDRQHASLSIEAVENIVRAADLNGLPTLVRLRIGGTNAVNNLLDAGVAGLVIPQVEHPEAAKDVYNAAQYEDSRSFAMSTRAGWFGNRSRDEYLDWVAEEIVVIAQIESVGGVERAEEIGGVDGVDALMVGPADLGLSMGVEPGSDELNARIDEIYDAADAAGCGVGGYVDTTKAFNAERERSTFFVYRSDIDLAVGGIEDVLE